jgi:catalase
MPLPTDEKLLALAEDLLKQFDTVFGLHPGFRPAHAKGTVLTGTFTPSPGADSLTRAPHIQKASTAVTVRFSDSTGIPVIPDNDPNANPRGIAIRFHLGDRIHTDIIAVSADGFPVHTGAEFLEFLRAVAASAGSKASPSPIEMFLGSHPTALAFVQSPKPVPSSFARATYFGVTAMRFINKDGVGKFGRYRIVPEAGNDYLSDAALAAESKDFLFDEIAARISGGPVAFRVMVQMAADGDVVDNATTIWPADRPLVEFGKVVLTAAHPESAAAQKQMIFDPIPRVDGIDPSDDPLLEVRAALYLLSGRRRRAA